MKIEQIAEILGIPRAGTSKELMFAKTSAMDTVWHIVDWTEILEDRRIIALHGAYIRCVVEADSLLQLSLKEQNEILFCEGCLQEYMLAQDLIARSVRKQFIERGGRIGRILQ